MEQPNFRNAECCGNCRWVLRGYNNYFYCKYSREAGRLLSLKELLAHIVMDTTVCDNFDEKKE